MTESQNLRIVTKWMGFVAAIWVQCISGNNYTFANYSADLKRVMSYSQLQLNSLGVAKDVGKSVGLLAGYLADFLPPQVILVIGALVGAVGYGGTWLVVSERIAPPSFWQMCIVVFLGGNSSTWMNTAVLVTCVRNFAGRRGTVSGILKGFVGLSTAIFTVLCSALFTGSSSAFLLLLTFLPAGICLVAAVFLRQVPVSNGAREDQEEESSFTILNVLSFLLALYLLIYTFAESALTPLISKLFASGLIVILVSPLIVPVRILIANWILESMGKGSVGGSKEPLLSSSSSSSSSSGGGGSGAEEEDLPLSVEKTEKFPEKKEKEEVSEYQRPKLGDNFTFMEIVVTVDFWILFLTFLSGIGTGMAVINNMGQIGQALGQPDVAMYVSFFSIFGFFGRIGAGAISEYYVRSAAIPRPVWMAASKVFMILGYLALAWGVHGSLPFGSIMVGICYGIHITIVVATSSEMFGLKSFGILYNVLVLNIPLGSFLFSGLLAGYFYDKEAMKQPAVPDNFTSPLSVNPSMLSDEATVCYGEHCFRSLFIILSFVLAVGLILDFILIVRLRPVFQKLYGSRQASASEWNIAKTT